MVERAGSEAKLGFKAHPHMLRHACGYALANRGHDTRALQAYLGHRNIQHTVRYSESAPTAIWKPGAMAKRLIGSSEPTSLPQACCRISRALQSVAGWKATKLVPVMLFPASCKKSRNFGYASVTHCPIVTTPGACDSWRRCASPARRIKSTWLTR